MLLAISKIKTYTKGLTFEAFMADSRTVEAVERNFEIIGEAAHQLPQSFRDQHTEIVWYSLISFRNRLIHGYFGVDYEILWYIVQYDLPDLERQLLIL
jgi:uncharacterized protein with HEPN domain